MDERIPGYSYRYYLNNIPAVNFKMALDNMIVFNGSPFAKGTNRQ